MEIDAYLDRLASDEPVPGGGSAAAIVASLGAALVAMVARITANSPKYRESAETALNVARRADNLRHHLNEARLRDERAFADVVTAQTLPKGTEDEKSARTAALQNALFEAAQAPLFCATLALDVLELARAVSEIGNRGLASDAGCAAEFGAAAVSACAYNVRVNHLYLRDSFVIQEQRDRLARIESRANECAATVREIVYAALAPKERD